jgi:cystinosin
MVSAVAWSVSFYGQIWTNYKLQSVQGFSLEYQIFNQTGYICYFVYTTTGYFFSEEYTGRVDLNDVLFAYHALFAVIVTSLQCCYYPRKGNQVSLWAVLLNGGIWVSVLLLFTLLQTDTLRPSQYLNLVSYLGYVKLAISFMKYTPPAVMNCRRGSTKGWSIFNILLDLVGGICLILQVVLELLLGEISLGHGLNVAKTILAVLTIVYDSIFIIQHYVLFRGQKGYSQLEGEG